VKGKVVWEDLYEPFECGGLGIKNLKIWNKALIAKYFWILFTDKTSLWVR